MSTCALALTFACQYSRRIADPEASKPDDWDEDAPREILDEEAEKPEGWLDDEPEEIDDPGQLHMGVFDMLETCFPYLLRAIIRYVCVLSWFMDCRSCVTECCSEHHLWCISM